MALRLQTVAAPQGARWVRRGFQVFLQRPLSFSALLLAFLFASLLASVVLPIAGSLLSLMAIPLLSLGFMIATRSALSGGAVHPGQLIEPLRAPWPRRKPLLQLCAVYGVLVLLIVLGTNAVIGDAWERLAQLYTSKTPVSPEDARAVIGDPRLQGGLLLQALLLSLLSIPFWHAPALVLWGEQGLAQSLFSSTVALWRTKAAFSVYALVWLALVLSLSMVASLLFALIGLPQLAPAAGIPIALMCMAAFYVTLYFTFVDSFQPDERLPG
jgi:hypothetical protein